MAETETIKLYDDTVTIDYYPNSHRYKLVELDGESRKDWIKSPSSIISKLDKSQALIPWAVNCFQERVIEEMRDGVNFTKDDVLSMLELGKNAHREKKEAAASVGTIVHEYAQNHLELDSVEQVDGYDELTDEDKEKARNSQKAFDSWYSQLGGTSVRSEFLVYSKKHNYVGRCDELYNVDGKLILLDYKTSKGIYTSQVYQVAGYVKAYEEETGEQIDGTRLVHLNKETGEFGELYLSRSDLVQAFKAFKALKVVADTDYEISKLLK